MDALIETKHATRIDLTLALSTGILFGCSFPPFRLGMLACISLVPLLLLIERTGSLRKLFTYSYLSFFVASCVSLYWVGGFTHAKDPYLMMAGAFVLCWQPVVYSLVVLSYRFVRTSLGRGIALAALPFLWVTLEWLYALGEFAFPWLTLGNTQTYQLSKIQFAEITGVYGISLWVVAINVLFFLLALRLLTDGERYVRHAMTFGLGILALYVMPDFYSAGINEAAFSIVPSRSMTVGIVQPNIDPWEKWEGTGSLPGRWHQVEKYLEVMRKQKEAGVQMSVWPETAILFNLPQFAPEYGKVRQTVDSLRMSLTSGYINYQYYSKQDAPAASSVIRGTDVHYDSYNAILHIEPGNAMIQSYRKMRLVPFAERVPYATNVPFLIEPLRWGVGISNWGIGKDSTVFTESANNAKFLAMVCYESIFPEFVSSFVKRGAEFLVFITNDSWWGNTSGARQHNQFAVLRAIENRRWVIRCANGGISCFIDPLGRMYDTTSMYTEASISRTIGMRDEQTFYTRHGDWIARIASYVSILALLGSSLGTLTMWRNKLRTEPRR